MTTVVTCSMVALRYLRRGRALDEGSRHDFDFHLGRAYVVLERYPEALRAYRRSLAKEDHAVTHANLGFAHESMGDYRTAYLAYQRSLELQPEGVVADRLRRKIVEQYLPKSWSVGTVVRET